jgi:APA family basic amino acid/polyamine antiporter
MTAAAPARKLGLWMLTALVAGNMIGSGVFLLPSSLAGIGSISLVSWLFTTTGAFMLGMTFFYLSRMLPKTGGPYAYAQEGFGQFIGFQTAYSYWMALWIGNAAIVVAMIGYLQVFFPSLAESAGMRLGLAIGIVWLLTFVNAAGVREAGMVQLVTMILKLIPLGFVAIFGWFFINPEHFVDHVNVTHDPVLSDYSAISLAATLTLWAFIGLESATVPADSVENPQRNIPRATILGILIAAIIYIAGSITIIGIIPNDELQISTSPYADAASVILGALNTETWHFNEWGRWIVALGAIISCFGCLNGWTLLQAQVPMAAANDGLFPKFFAKRNSRGVPLYGLIFTSFLVTGLLLLTANETLVEQFEIIILLAVLSCLIPYLYATMSLIILRKKYHMQSKWPVVFAVLASIYVMWAIFSAGAELLFYGCTIFFSSIPLYGIFLAKRAAGTTETVAES